MSEAHLPHLPHSGEGGGGGGPTCGARGASEAVQFALREKQVGQVRQHQVLWVPVRGCFKTGPAHDLGSWRDLVWVLRPVMLNLYWVRVFS